MRTGPVAQRRSAADALARSLPLSPAAVAAFVLALADRDPAVAAQAAQAVRDLGSRATQPLLDAFADPLADGAVLKAVARTLAALWPANQAHPLIQDLLCGDASAQCEAAAALGLLGRKASDAVPALLWSLRNAPDAKVREAAGLALGQLGPLLPVIVEALVRILEADPVTDPGPRRAAIPGSHAAILGRIGTPAAVAALLGVLRGHPDAGTRGTVATALGAIVPSIPATVGPLVEALADASPAVREAAGLALVAMGEGAVAGLTDALRDERLEVRQRAAAALGRMAPASRDVVEALGRATADGDGRVVVQAAVAVLKIFAAHESLRRASAEPRGRADRGRADERALAVLVGVVRRRTEACRHRQEAAEALGRLGPAVRAAAGALAEVVVDAKEDRLVRQSAWWALQRIAPEKAAGLKSP
jgi:HEAT repeat protein